MPQTFDPGQLLWVDGATLVRRLMVVFDRLQRALAQTNRGQGTAPLGANVGDSNATLTVGQPPIQQWTSALTANRTVTLATTGALNGDRFRIVRTGLGAFTLTVGAVKTMPAATAAWAEVHYDGTAWRLTGYGTL